MISVGPQFPDFVTALGSGGKSTGNKIGRFAAPDVIHPTRGLPKTRSGKVMRRILRKVAAAEYDGLGDISTLSDPTVVEEIVREHMDRK